MISTFTLVLNEKKQLTEHILHVTFTLKDNKELEFMPGQYVILHIPQADGKTARRLYSMASPNTVKNAIELIVELVPNGVASEHIKKMNPGEEVIAQGPAGMFTVKETERDIVFLATGTGIAPMRSMLLHILATDPSKHVHLYWGFPTFKSIYLFDEFKALAKQFPNFHFINCLSRESDLSCITNQEDLPHFQIGHVNDAFEKEISGDLNQYQYYVCGGPKVVESLKEYLAGKGIEKDRIHFEKFTV